MPAEDIRAHLEALADPSYQAFQSKLLPTVDSARVLGVRMPALRRYAKQLLRDAPDAATAFLEALPHEAYDEDMLHGVLLNELRDYDAVVAALDAFLPHVDNWAVCDVLAPRAFASHPAGLVAQARSWMASAHPFTRRFGVGVLMRGYLGECFEPAYLQLVADVAPCAGVGRPAQAPAPASGDYYVRMMVAWFFAEALARQWDEAAPYLERHRLDPWTHAKALQKAIESRKLSPEQKDYVRSLRASRG